MSFNLNPITRKIWAEKTFELTNIGAGALLFGQFLPGGGFSWSYTLTGFILVIIGYIASYLFSKDLKK